MTLLMQRVSGCQRLGDKMETRMVEVGGKPETLRTARARGEVLLAPGTVAAFKEGALPKGDPIQVARVAGIMAAKRCPEIVPLCHPLLITGVEIQFQVLEEKVVIEASVAATGRTGVEMEALTAVSAAALTIYDMCKGLDKEMIIDKIYLMEKQGGRSGHYVRKEGKNAP